MMAVYWVSSAASERERSMAFRGRSFHGWRVDRTVFQWRGRWGYVIAWCSAVFCGVARPSRDGNLKDEMDFDVRKWIA
jgi:hypothetical protein